MQVLIPKCAVVMSEKSCAVYTIKGEGILTVEHFKVLLLSSIKNPLLDFYSPYI